MYLIKILGKKQGKTNTINYIYVIQALNVYFMRLNVCSD